MSKALVYQTDFGTADGAVSAMYGVALKVDPALSIFDLTHDIPQYNIWEASYRLVQTVQYWPEGTVLVSVVDPGVGSSRQSVAVRTTMLRRDVPTPGSTTDTNTVPSGQYCTVCTSRYEASQMLYCGMSCVRSKIDNLGSTLSATPYIAETAPSEVPKSV